MPENKDQSVELEKIYVRKVSFQPKTMDIGNRTVDVVWTTGARVDRHAYEMELDLGDEAVDLSRLNNRAPVLDNHDSAGGLCGPAQGLHGRSLGQIGVVERAWFEGKGKRRKGFATLRFSKREGVDEILNDIADGIICNISVGFSIQKYEEIGKNEERDTPIYRATRWTPAEISPVQAGADDAAMIRSADKDTVELPTSFHTAISAPQANHFNNVLDAAVAKITDAVSQITRKIDEPEKPIDTNINLTENRDEEKVMPTNEIENEMEKVRKENQVKVAEAAKTAAEVERQRSVDITEAVKVAGLERGVADELIKNGVSIDEARKQIIEKVGEKQRSAPTNSVIVGEDRKAEHVRSGLQNAWLARGKSEKYKLDDHGKEFRGFSLVKSAAVYLEEVQGVTRALRMDAGEIVHRALSTSDFPELLANTMGKSLRDSYMDTPVTFEQFVRRVSVPDFKQISRTNLGDAPKLEEVKEHGAVKLGKISEAAEKYNIKTYAKKLRMTRKMLIDDDMDAFIRIPAKFGIAARSLESDLVWTDTIVGAGGLGSVMADTLTLFHATHANIGAGVAFDVDPIGALEILMLKQKGLDSAKIVIPAVTIYGPVALRTKFRKFLAATQVTKDGDVNPFKDLNAVTEPRLDDNSITRYYLFSSVANVDMLELATLDGSNGQPMIETKQMGGVEGIEVEAIHDVGVAPIDWRGMTTDAGA